jgi:hypothetical protein
MKLVTLIILFCLQSVIFAQQPLTNQDVVNLMKSGLGDAVIIAKIKSTGGNFDTSPASLQELKSLQISESIILAMIESIPSSLSNALNLDSPKSYEDSSSYNELLLRGGTRVEIELAYTVSSADLREGDAVSFLVVNPVLVNGVTVIERGASATARVIRAETGKSWGRGGQLTWNIQNVSSVDGQKIPLHFSDSSAKGGGASGTVTTGIVVTSLLFWPAAPFWGFKKGKPAVIPAGRRFEVFVYGDSLIAIEEEPPSKSRGLKQVESRSRILNAPRSGACYENGRKVPCR